MRFVAFGIALVVVGLTSGAWPPGETISVRAQAKDADDVALGADLSRRGLDAWRAGRLREAETLWLDALAAFARAGAAVDQANVLRNLTFLTYLSVDDRLALLDRAVALVLPLGHAHREGTVRAQRADLYFLAGDLASAANDLDIAVHLLQQHPDSRNALARALTSRGRLYRLLRRMTEAAADQQRAAEILEQLQDWQGASQAWHGLATTLLDTDDSRAAEALSVFERAVADARRSGDPDRLAMALAQTGEAAEVAGRLPFALGLIEEAGALTLRPGARAFVDATAARLLLSADRPTEALVRIDRALASSDPIGVDSEQIYRWRRAAILDRLERADEALAESTAAFDLLEAVRPRLVPDDGAKRGFGESRSFTLLAHIERLARAGRMDEALEVAERGRGRAFLDLLASTDLRGVLPPATAASEPAGRSTPLATGDEADRRGETVRSPRLDRLVASRAGAPRGYAPRPEPEIASVAVVDPPTLASIRAQAARLDTHVLSYWVLADRTLIWIVAPDGRITSAVSDITESRLAALVEQSWSGSAGGTVRGDAGEPAWRLATRGSDRLTFGEEARRANRELYRRLIAPVRDALPPSGGLVTIVPHGVLFRLAFAALVAPSGQYLIEQWPIHYAPSASALEFTARRRGANRGPVLVVADPEFSPSGGEEPLARLPGAAVEGRQIAATLGADRTIVVRGAAATEARVRGAAAAASVLHFATHGVIRDDRPFESFLALAGAGSDPSTDGRLTMAEVYGLRLDAADLVVLSACRSALGPVTGDGIVGLTRGFFAAGSPSVVASLWDVPDAVTSSIFTAFYRAWDREASKAEALRRAQLAILRDLRAGRISVDTPAGRFALPEHPSLWAGLVLVGEP